MDTCFAAGRVSVAGTVGLLGGVGAGVTVVRGGGTVGGSSLRSSTVLVTDAGLDRSSENRRHMNELTKRVADFGADFDLIALSCGTREHSI
jgi:hypothetical protein